jgi:hypothetical protein
MSAKIVNECRGISERDDVITICLTGFSPQCAGPLSQLRRLNWPRPTGIQRSIQRRLDRARATRSR